MFGTGHPHSCLGAQLCVVSVLSGIDAVFSGRFFFHVWLRVQSRGWNVGQVAQARFEMSLVLRGERIQKGSSLRPVFIQSSLSRSFLLSMDSFGERQTSNQDHIFIHVSVRIKTHGTASQAKN